MVKPTLILLLPLWYDSREMKKDFRKVFKGIDRKALALELGSSRNVIDQVVGGYKQVSPKRALDIERATKGKIRAKALRPDIFGNGKK